MRVRVKSTGMTLLGMDDEGGGRRGSSRAQPAQEKEESGALPSPGNLLRGIFGR